MSIYIPRENHSDVATAAAVLRERMASGVAFSRELRRVATSYALVTYAPNARLASIGAYPELARFDTQNVYQFVKHAFRARPGYLAVLFPSREILDSFETVHANEEIVLSDACMVPEHPKLVLLEIFNAFFAGGRYSAVALPYYYSPLDLAEHVDDVVS
ncbi:virion core [Western grey kangaroopox virus]|uniref:Virion core n=1 Tax=Western grey kangaroopox virus TaxID=1566307 RepID=A0A2C9DSP2_9POXV|nr:virion core [Western grey kangaroopox virus]ATI21025.1 virion core [Western grey kangaroopox virus]